ncbi:MAG: phosphoethanolamine transferase [Phascolarctobacterium sp.]|nr:phosphoethanolamine transferase [Phascolarctobacterium sp.]
MKFIRNNIKYLFLFIIVYIFLFGTYYLFSTGLQPRTLGLSARRYIPCALVVALAVKLWDYTKQPLKNLSIPALISIAWALIYPACFWLAYHASTSFIDKHFDHAFAAYAFACFVALSLLLKKILSVKISSVIATIVQLALLFVPLLQLQYFGLYQLPITEAGAVALLQTNFNEAKEYAMLNIGFVGILLTVVVILALIYLLYKNNSHAFSYPVALSKTAFISSLVLFVATGIYCAKIFPATGVMEAYGFAKEYYQKSMIFQSNHEKNFAALEVSPNIPKFAKPSTIIMVIGESASTHFMSAYNKTENNTTPWLKEMVEQEQFYKVKHAYTSWTQTVPSLERALTNKDQYNNVEFFDSTSILDVAKKAGYTTYWYSNQGSISDADTPITLVAQTADHAKWLCDTSANSNKMLYDGELLKFLEEVDPTKNNFVVFHVMGSHDDTINRYPPEFARFEKPGKFNTIANYDDSLAYTDEFLKQTFAIAKDKLNLQAMVYFSDHGGEPRIRRSPDPKGFIPRRVPFVFWLSDEYKSLYPETASQAKISEDRYFTNDLTFETICNILQVKASAYEETDSILSPTYRYNRDNLLTDLGKTKISEDTDGK